MCQDATKKAYMILTAFEEAGSHLSINQIIERVKQIGSRDEQHLGKSSRSAGTSPTINRLFIDSSIEHSKDKGFFITQSGKNRLKRLKGYVYPA